MGRARVLEEIRIMRFEELLERRDRGYLTQLEMGEMLGVSERTVRRRQERCREEGAAGLGDRRIGRASPRRAPESELARAKALYAEMYRGFTAKHFHEHLQARHGYRLGYTVTRLALQEAGLVKRSPRRGAHRRKRPRRPLPGMLLHQDAARHAWLAGRPPLDLVVTLDDATNEIYSALPVAEEGAASSFRALAEVIAAQGLFCALYTDRGSHSFRTPVAGGGVDRRHPTQVGRALAQLGIEHIAAYSPQARGRSERLFRTLEDRLPKELALAGITDIDAANAWLRAVYLPAHTARFAAAPRDPGSAFVAAAPAQWREVLCLQATRQVGNDNTVRWSGRVLQIPKSPLRPHFARANLRLHECPDGAVGLFWGPHRIADFPPPAAEPHDLAA
jgi:transposase